jgi:hypothetical protein
MVKYRPYEAGPQAEGVPYSRLIADKSKNMRTPILDTHRQIRRLVYTPLSGWNLRFHLPRRFRMAIQAHLVELERKHKILENELHEALVHLSTDDLQIVELKRRKLMVKDEIERLKHTASETLH